MDKCENTIYGCYFVIFFKKVLNIFITLFTFNIMYDKIQKKEGLLFYTLGL